MYCAGQRRLWVEDEVAVQRRQQRLDLAQIIGLQARDDLDCRYAWFTGFILDDNRFQHFEGYRPV
jgi:hypothetical protein